LGNQTQIIPTLSRSARRGNEHLDLLLPPSISNRARLFFREPEYPWREAKNSKGDLVTNRTAKDDLADAELAILGH
jgi:hypothetical protein